MKIYSCKKFLSGALQIIHKVYKGIIIMNLTVSNINFKGINEATFDKLIDRMKRQEELNKMYGQDTFTRSSNDTFDDILTVMESDKVDIEYKSDKFCIFQNTEENEPELLGTLALSENMQKVKKDEYRLQDVANLARTLDLEV